MSKRNQWKIVMTLGWICMAAGWIVYFTVPGIIMLIMAMLGIVCFVCAFIIQNDSDDPY